jgi:hypothetical protein
MTNALKHTTKRVDTQRYGMKRYVIGRTPKTIPAGRLVIHNSVRPPGFPTVAIGDQGFRVWIGRGAPDAVPRRPLQVRVGSPSA